MLRSSAAILKFNETGKTMRPHHLSILFSIEQGNGIFTGKNDFDIYVFARFSADQNDDGSDCAKGHAP